MPLSVVTEAQAIDYIVSQAAAGRGGWVITPNLDQFRQYYRSAELQAMYERANVVLADGMPLVWASRIQKTPLPQRVPGSALIFSLNQAAAIRGVPVFLLGGNPGAAKGAAEVLSQRYPGLKIVGTHCPPMGFEKSPAEIDAMRQMLSDAQPGIVFVGLGFPKQERLIESLRSAAPGAWFLGIGISLSFASGEVVRAPRWIQKLGLEWVHRMVQEPGRLVKRYLVHGIPFAVVLLRGAVAARWRKT
jgi:N-acetylglucosaminyldiphosphoundecaprenol N-acetyl-beta-D-mannosaminyltransferase